MQRSKRYQYYLSMAVLALAAAGFLASCASSKVLLNRAEEAWARGAYIEAINTALDSYEKAVDKNRKPEEITAAKDFLLSRFPMANENLLNEALRKDKGSDEERATSWQIWNQLVGMNRRIKDSRAASFLSPRDYTAELAAAKETAAQIRYVEALELIGRDERESYIRAASLLSQIDTILSPGFRDIAVLRDLCYEKATLTIAFSNRSLDYSVRNGSIGASGDLRSMIFGSLESYIRENDYPDFLEFITVASSRAAEDSGASLFIELRGDVWVSAATRDTYSQDGIIIWERSYGGTPILAVTRLSDNTSEIASAPLTFNQTVQVEFYPQRYQTSSLTADLYNNRFNNSDWMDFQLLTARIAVDDPNGTASMSVWADMEYGGKARFLTDAEVAGEDGVTVKPVDYAVYDETERFLNSDLPQFLNFSDIALFQRINDEITNSFLSTPQVKELLSNLE